MSSTRLFRAATAFALAVVFSIPLLAQTGGSTPGQPTGRPARPPTTPSPQPSPREPERRMVFVSGRVVLDDGTPPQERVSIERICGGSVRREAYTDSKGYFSLTLGGRSEMHQDASASSFEGGGLVTSGSQSHMAGVTETEMMNCELRAALPGYRSSTVRLAGRRSLDHPDIGTIVLVRPERQQGTMVSVTSLRVPRHARRLLDQGRKAAGSEKWGEARTRMEQALAQHPDYADAWFEMGLLHQGQGNLAEAQQAYAKAVAADPKFVRPYFHLADIAIQSGQWAEAAKHTHTLLELDPISLPRAYFYDAIANLNLGNLEVAERSARRCLLFTPAERDPMVALLLGRVLLHKHDYPGAVENFSTYLKLAPNDPNAVAVRGQLHKLQQMQELQRNGAPPAAEPPRKEEP